MLSLYDCVCAVSFIKLLIISSLAKIEDELMKTGLQGI